VSVLDDSIRSNSIGVVRSKSVYWPKFANERIVNLGFLRSYKDYSHREDGAMLELLGVLDLTLVVILMEYRNRTRLWKVRLLNMVATRPRRGYDVRSMTATHLY